MNERILVVDDDKDIARLVASYLEEAGYRASCVHDGEAALHAIHRERPDLLVLDLMLPLRDGYDITRRVRSDPSTAGLPIIVLTARVADTDKIVGLELGADDYVTKPFNPLEVVARVRALLRRAAGGAGTSRALRVGSLSLDPDRHEVTLEGRPIELTPTEFAVLETLMTHPGRAFTRSELIEIGLGVSYEGMERTIDSHVKNLRRKVEAESPGAARIETVYGVGYRLSDRP